MMRVFFLKTPQNSPFKLLIPARLIYYFYWYGNGVVTILYRQTYCAVTIFTTGITLDMKNYLLPGMIVLAYGMSPSAFSSDTATLTINGRVATPTCSTSVVNSQLQQRCGDIFSSFSAQDIKALPSVRGVTTEITHLPGDVTRQIVLNCYD